MMEHSTMPIGVVLERRKIDNPWVDFSWRAIAVIPGAAPLDPAKDDWKVLAEGDGFTHFHAATFDLELFKKETEGYRTNISSAPPSVYVVLHPDEEGVCDHEVLPFLITCCPFEAESYVESGDEKVDAVIMPPQIQAWVEDFIADHHVDVPFKKRKQKKAFDPRKNLDGPKPPIDRGGI